MQEITPFLWFDGQAEEAINFYVSIFKDAKIVSMNRYPEQVPGMSGKVMTGIFELNGKQFMAIDGGPQFKFTEAISFFVKCETQEEVDHLWSSLSAGGPVEAQQCGWLKDKYGISWQIIPSTLGELMSNSDPQKVQRVMQAMLKMKKIDIAELKKASEG